MNNKYGVDVNYFKKELKHLSDSLDNRTPEELHRYLMVLANTARPLSDDAVLGEVPNITDDNIQELREIILDSNSSKTYQNRKIKEWFVRHFA